MNIEKQLFEHLIAAYLEKYRERLIIETVKALGGGCINNTLKIETNVGALFLKWNSNGANDLFICEAESLNEFQKSNNQYVVFPKPLLCKKIDQTPGYLLTNYLEPGRTLNDDENLGRGLACLHQLSHTQFGFMHHNYCGATIQNNTEKPTWLEFYKQNRILHIVSLIKKTRSWSADDENTTDRFLNKIEQLIPDHSKPALIHGDLWSGNYMYSSQGPALIDPCASYCDREFEMGIMTMFGGFSDRVYDAYNEIYPLPADWKERNSIYQLYHVLNHYYLFGGYYKNQALEIMKRYS